MGFIDFFTSYGFVFELIVATAIFVYSLKMRKFFILRLILAAGTLLGIYILWQNFVPKNLFSEIIIHTAFFFITAAAVFVCFKTTFWVALFCEIGAYATQHMAYKTGSYFTHILDGVIDKSVLYLIYLLAVAAVIIASYYIFARKIKKNEAKYIENKQVTLLCAALILFTTACQNIYNIYEADLAVPLITVITMYDVLCGIFTICIQYGMFRSGKLIQDNHLMEHIIHLQQDQFESSKQNIDIINIKCHDLKHQLTRLKERISDEERRELEKAISIYDSALKTGNEILDVVLAEKTLICEKEHIKLNCIANGECLNFMKTADMYSIFGNILDNAIEAVSTIGDLEKRIITLTVKESLGMVYVRIENYFFASLQFENELPVTTKSNKAYHGYGLKSVKMIVEKYNGTFSLSVEDDIFNLNILFPVPKTN